MLRCKRRVTAQHCMPCTELILCTYKTTMVYCELSADLNYVQQRDGARSAADLTWATLRWLGNVVAVLLWRFPADVLKLDLDTDLPLGVAMHWLKYYMT